MDLTLVLMANWQPDLLAKPSGCVWGDRQDRPLWERSRLVYGILLDRSSVMARVRRGSEGCDVAWSETFKAMGDRTRLSILLKLMQGEQCVTDIGKALKMDAPKVSFHLTRLKYAGLVAQERQGQRVIYRINPELGKKSGDGFVFDVDGCLITFPKR